MSDFDEKLIERLKRLEREVERLQVKEQPVGAWQSYTVSWTAATTNPSIGNGTLSGRYVQIGKTVMGSICLKCGSTTTYGSGAWLFGLPKTVANSGTPYLGTFTILDIGYIFYSGAVNIFPGTVISNFIRDNDGNGILSSTTPHTWAVNDELKVAFTYETS